MNSLPDKISVCIATYNGEKYIKDQLNSILFQINKNDEVIISDDHSTDKTIEILNSFNDKRIKIFTNDNGKGPINNFENAIKKSSGDFIFLSDQDDIWCNDKVFTIMQFFDQNPNCTCIFSNAQIVDENGKKMGYNFFKNEPNLNLFKIIIKNKFLGCTMAFKREIKILPFTKNIPMHDWYIGLKHLQRGNVKFINKNLIYYRRHSNNFTSDKSSSFKKIIKWRLQIIKAVFFTN